MQRRDGTGGDRGHSHVGALIASQTQDVFDAAKVSDHAEAWFTVLAKGLDDAVIAMPVGVVGLKRRHQLGIYTNPGMRVKASFAFDSGREDVRHESVYTDLDD
jgi:hypothetical protein